MKYRLYFMDVDGLKIEMLFVLLNYFNKGISNRLIVLAIKQYDVLYVDVNE